MATDHAHHYDHGSGHESHAHGPGGHVHAPATAPPGLDVMKVSAFLRGREGVDALHDLHIWPMSTTETALTAHLLTPAGYPGDEFSAGLAFDLKEKFGIGHVTLQIETDPSTPCVLEPDHVV